MDKPYPEIKPFEICRNAQRLFTRTDREIVNKSLKYVLLSFKIKKNAKKSNVFQMKNFKKFRLNEAILD